MSKLIKQKVISLRKQGNTYTEINNSLKKNLSKSTLSYWCKNIKIKKKFTDKIKKQNLITLGNARKKALIVNKNKKEIYFKNLHQKNKNLINLLKNKKFALICLACLYLAEGGKKQKGAVMFGNSDPGIINLFLKLLRFVYVIDEKKFRCTLQGRYGQNVDKLEKFWSNTTKIPLAQFYKARLDKRTMGQKIKKPEYKGVCRIDYLSANIFHELMIIGKILVK